MRINRKLAPARPVGTGLFLFVLILMVGTAHAQPSLQSGSLVAGAAAQIIWYPNPPPAAAQPTWPPPPAPISLTAATVTLKIINPAGAESTVSMTVGVDSLGNQVALYNVQAGDFPTPGTYVLEMWVVPSGGSLPYKTRQRSVQVGASS